MFYRNNIRGFHKLKVFFRSKSSLQSEVINKAFIDENGVQKTNPGLKDFVQKSIHSSYKNIEKPVVDNIPYVDDNVFKVNGLKGIYLLLNYLNK